MQTPDYCHAGNMRCLFTSYSQMERFITCTQSTIESAFLLSPCLSFETFSEVGEIERLRHGKYHINTFCFTVQKKSIAFPDWRSVHESYWINGTPDGIGHFRLCNAW